MDLLRERLKVTKHYGHDGERAKRLNVLEYHASPLRPPVASGPSPRLAPCISIYEQGTAVDALFAKGANR